MLRDLTQFAWRKSTKVLSFLLLCLLIIIYTFLPLERKIPDRPRWTIRAHHLRSYPESLSAIDHNRIRPEQPFESIFLLNENQTDQTIDSSAVLNYSESIFRSAPFPIIWLDAQNDVRWNRVAQHELLNYLLEKQFPQEKISTCLTRQLIILEQWKLGGFFSRYHCFIEQFGQTLYSPSMAMLSFTRFTMAHSSVEDFHSEGVLRYFQSFSLCSAHIKHPKLKVLYDFLRSIDPNSAAVKIFTDVHQLLERDESKVKYKYSREVWKFGYDHVPHRRWLFDRNREEIKKILNYHSPIHLLINHSNEHIYFLISNIYRDGDRGMHRTTADLIKSNQVFTSFLRYILLLFFSPLTPRIQASAKLLAHHWSEYLSDKLQQPYEEALTKMAVLFIRRGDKAIEDSFWQKHKYWRNISLFVKSVVDAEKRRPMNFTTVFVITDDAAVMTSIQEYSRVGLTSAANDEAYARQHLHGRQILYNVFAPQSCFDPFIRIGLDQFLVNVQFVTDYAALVVGHSDSNVGRYFEEIIYVHRQHQPNVQAQTFVVNAPDSLDEKNS